MEEEKEFRMPGAPAPLEKPTEDVEETPLAEELAPEKPVEEVAEEQKEKEETQEEAKPAEEEPKEDVEESEKEEEEKPSDEEPKAEGEEAASESKISTHIFALRTTANREDQVMDFITSNIQRKKLGVYSIIRPHGMRGYIFLEAESRQAADEAARSIPYARGILPKEVQYSEIEHMLEQVKREVNIRKNDIVEIISGPFKREQAKISRIDKIKEEVVVELLEAAVPIPITLKLDAVKVIRREGEEEEIEE